MSGSIYEQVFETAQAGIALHDPETEALTEVNQAYADALGYDQPVLVGSTLGSVVARLDRDALRSATEVALDGGSSQVDVVVRGADGADREVTMGFETLGDGGDKRLVSSVHSATGSNETQELSEQRPHQQRQQYRELASVLDAAPLILYRIDSEGIFRDVRGEMLSRLGLEADDLLGESIWELYADNEQVLEAAERALEGEVFRYTLTLGEVTLETQYTPVYTDGEVTGAIGVSMDVTELHRQRDRMEFFNSILRHDVLNGMTVIKMRGELLADQLEGDHQRYAQTIVDWCDTTTEVTKRVRQVVDTLANPTEDHEFSRVDVSTILQRKKRELVTAYPAVEFEVSVPDGLQVRADELLAEVLGNILTNSIEHNESEGLRVAVSGTVDGETIRLRIADNGTGVDAERAESIFRRGETSAKETGSGFGLFFVDVMVEKYGGDVWVEDSTSGGACFVVELPFEGQREGR